ncbi:MAG: glutamate 5-kinase [Zetaproteobacteria bacterium CG_4_9_14_3_um_filter_49_83]|nr:MAG: glutamate 5-kinase [Zetaproteobacteria bacterium CG1_02_49_23]PIQ30476.1 MAG: glutamate 5-kinase [Zetaproteobacteria bacterium CG17_big_fil_post_rev_8_21_14_2_50_50_13]PIV31601.1 MAG: glutamate 5-kinase [Zetaproteobacteria bacterium CG02_land_8_20_14_3_00_50_9]PIY55258.1 MAG: glutamate 5-kinase [Zetaproteobacteria bacterium CG_4_10_14_0_8_um_filter_49_80]PJA36070.1 MAG: glutamate 5-kinase [Zetaproteobacteria bacterium CG_4_9_14_3_um_filter_49_83]
MINSRQQLSMARRVVVKVGSSLLTDHQQGICRPMVDSLARRIAALHARGVQVCLVSSGAVAVGCVHLGWIGKRLTVHEKQAAAAVGQPWLMQVYREAFAVYDIQVAQMLLTKDDLRHRRRYLNASNTSETLFSAGIVPIVNENDTVMVEEIKFGDNDTLSALVSLVIDAELLVMMTDVDGFYDKNPVNNADARRFSVVKQITDTMQGLAEGAGSSVGTGGMQSKLNAAKLATRGGVPASIIHGKDPQAFERLFAGEDVGTVFLCGENRQTRRHQWIADILKPAGQITMDAGAEQAILNDGCSLLPIGMTELEGVFDKGECVELVGAAGMVVARGLVNYSSDELRRLIGVKSDAIESILGYVDFNSVIHRDNLVLTEPEKK